MSPASRPHGSTSLRRLALLSLLALFPHPAPLAHAGWFTADPTYLGYRIPEHRWSTWTASLDGSASHRASDNPVGFELRSGSVSGRFGTRAAWAFDSDPLAYGWSFLVDVNADRGRDRSLYSVPPSSTVNEGLQKRLSQYLTLGGSVRSYPWRAPIGLTLTINQVLQMQQQFSSGDGHAINPPNESRTTYSSGRGTRFYQGSLAAGTGLGRVRDATPVFRAQVLEARLLRAGSLSRALSTDARQKLAALFTAQFGVVFAHQRPDKYFWSEVERVLREDGALTSESLDAYDVLRLLEPLYAGSSISRRIGWFVGPAVTLVTYRDRETLEESQAFVQRSSGSVVFEGSSRVDQVRNERRDVVSTGLVAELHRPLGPRWQAHVSSNSNLSEAGEVFSAASSVGASYIVSDRWLATLRFDHFLLARGHGLERRAGLWGVNLWGELSYFLEDSWALRLTANESQSGSPFSLSRSGNVQLGITYVVSGLFRAPGLVDIMRPTPPAP